MVDVLPQISIVIPAYNESASVLKVWKMLHPVVRKLHAEVIWVDDGSTDGTYDELKKISRVKIVRLRKNFGQTAALMAGIREAKGNLLVTMDGDGQNDPQDIPPMIQKLNEGYDVISGWRKERMDTMSKRFVSRGADLLRKLLLGDEIHDSGCTLKVYRRECFDDLELYGEMHRFIPALLTWQGFRVGEVVVRHHPRVAGETKYSIMRTLKGFVDMVNVWFWYKYAFRPLHLFGGGGLMLIALGCLILGVMGFLRLMYGYALSDKIWPLVGFFFVLTGIQLFVSGVLADVAIRNYLSHPGRHSYKVRDVLEL